MSFVDGSFAVFISNLIDSGIFVTEPPETKGISRSIQHCSSHFMNVLFNPLSIKTSRCQANDDGEKNENHKNDGHK